MDIKNEDGNNNQIKKDLPYQGFNDDGSEIDYKEIFRAILRKKKWAFIAGSLTFFSILGYSINERFTNPVYSGSFRLLIRDPINDGAMRSGDTLSSDSATVFYKNLASNSRSFEVNSLMSLLNSPGFLTPLAEKYNLDPKALSSKIKISVPKTISVFNFNKTSELIVNMTTKNKFKGEKLLNDLSSIYLKESLKQRQKKLNDGIDFLRNQLPNVQQKENKLQTELVAFRKKHNLIDPSLEGAQLKITQRKIENSISELKAIGNRLEKVREEVLNGSLTARGFNERLGSDGAGLTISDFDQSLLSELISLENQLAEAKSKFTPSSSMVKGLELRLSQIQPIILKNQIEAVDIAINLNSNKLENTIQKKTKIEEEFQQQPILIKEFNRITQQLQVANNDLINLNSAITSFELELAQNNIPWRIISAPNINPLPIKPSIRRNSLIGLIISIFVGTFAALIRDQIDHVYHSSEDVKDSLKIPLLGEIPYIKFFSELRTKSNDLISLIKEDKSKRSEKKDQYQRFFYTEALRNLFTSIRFLNTGSPIKTLTISSSIPMEGKSLINILFAKTLNDMGERVLLIDADLRKPQMHNRLKMNNILGLSNILTDNQIGLEQVIKPLKDFPNISVMTSGTIPPDPTRLINSIRFKELIKEIKNSNKYDMVLFDTPPILGLADTILLSKYLDGIILLVGLGSVDRTLPKESLIRLKSNGLNALGIVTNSVKSQYALDYNKYMKYGGYRNYSAYNPYLTYSNYINEIDEKIENNEPKLIINKSLSEKFKTKFAFINKAKKEFFKWLDS